GVAVGDLDNDGFPDLYVCNIGGNELFWNNGDGTFTRTDKSQHVPSDDWSISATIGDVTGDPGPEIYVVNYLGGPDVFVRPCQERGRPIQCYPYFFPASQDRLQWNRADGSFEDKTHDTGCALPEGKGMGAILTDVGEGRLGILVANDTTANRLLIREAAPEEARHGFRDEGQLLGIAFDKYGATRSSMGVDAGDINGDGRPDFVVTNFFEETNNMFVSQPGGGYEDEASSRGLSADALQTEGWGTQFIDIDSDGDLDLFVANGHLDDWASRSGRMEQHLFVNRGGHFSRPGKETLAGYAAEDRFGRSVVQVDWNRDGREDLCVTHVKSPVELLTNQTQGGGHFVAFRLIGTSSSRDAIGATVTVDSGGHVTTRHLTAGGYASTSERRIAVGLAQTARVDSVEIRWPDGSRDQWTELTADRTYDCIQQAGVFVVPSESQSDR
ncbi:MAG: CRTAC1 family protein, partial [Planctomycetota bacterium]